MNDFYTGEITIDYLQRVFNAIPEAVVMTDSQNRIISANQTFETVFGFSEAEVRGKPLSVLYAAGEDFELEDKGAYHPKAGGDSQLYEVDYRRKSGEVFTGEVIGSTVTEEEGGAVGYFAVIRDLTSRNQREHELQTLYKRLQLLVEITTGQDLDIDMQINQALELTTRMLGLDMGIISHISGDTYTVKHYYPKESALEEGMEFELGHTYCDITYEADDVVLIDQMGLSQYKGHPCYEQFELESYIGIPLMLDGMRFGTVNFSSTDPRGEPYTKADKDMLRLLGEWLSTIIERQQREAELRQSREKFRLISEYSADMVCLHAPDGTYEYVSPSVVNILGYRPDELEGRSPYTLFHPDDLKRIREQSHDPAQAGNQVRNMHYRIKRKDGSYIWFETATEPIMDESGEVVKLRTGSRDITKRKKLELLLRETNRMAEVGGWEYDVGENELYWTDEVFRIHELPIGDEPEVETALSYYPDEASNRIEEVFTRAIEKGENYDIELPVITAEYNEKWVRAIGKVEQDENGNVYKVYGVFQDLTQRKAMEDQLREHNRQLENLHETTNKIYSVLGHDLKTPLSSIIGFSGIIADDLQDKDIDEKTLQFLNYINQSAVRMSGMINDLSHWARSQTGDLTLRSEEVDISGLIEDVVILLEPKAQQKKVSLMYDRCEGMKVKADAQMVKTITRNFISNAIKFSASEDEIDVRCAKTNDYWQIAVQDEGTGMSEETRRKLFSGDHPSEPGTENERGSGIGLKLCRKLARMHNGDIIVNSEEGEGSEFIFRVPFSN